MVSVKLLKPYYIKMNSEYIRIILAYQYFSLFINKKVYHFVPIEGQEILVNRRTKKVVNTETKFAFQKGKDVIYITMKKLTSLVDFMDQLEEIIEPYYEEEKNKERSLVVQPKEKLNEKTTLIIKELEEQNVRRLIDQALDERDVNAFYNLSKLL
ncbi:MAG TPA: IDEAL domain-containing protein [Pseudogracilibacillus sp.]|nr:IDEAL domain-containing protein [Pseudogracilibacillus sp.]